MALSRLQSGRLLEPHTLGRHEVSRRVKPPKNYYRKQFEFLNILGLNLEIDFFDNTNQFRNYKKTYCIIKIPGSIQDAGALVTGPSAQSEAARCSHTPLGRLLMLVTMLPIYVGQGLSVARS